MRTLVAVAGLRISRNDKGSISSRRRERPTWSSAGGCRLNRRRTREVKRRLTVEQILAWADAFYATHGAWPRVGRGSVSRVVAGAPRELWKDINKALVLGLRGLPGNSSLAELLAEHRGVPLPEPLPDRGPKVVDRRRPGRGSRSSARSRGRKSGCAKSGNDPPV